MIRSVLARIVAPILAGQLLGFSLIAACGPSFEEIEKAAAGGDVSSKLAKCRAEARADYYVGEKSVDEAMATYHACLKREGVVLGADGGK